MEKVKDLASNVGTIIPYVFAATDAICCAVGLEMFCSAGVASVEECLGFFVVEASIIHVLCLSVVADEDSSAE